MEGETVHEDRHDSEQEREDADIDWQAERRWSDRPWVPISVLVLFGGVEFALASRWWGWAVGAAVVSGWCVLLLLMAWQVRRLRRDISHETGLRTWQIPVVARRLQKERLTSDPQTRRAMAILVRRQHRQLRWGPWMWSMYTGLCPVLGALFLITGDTVHGVIWLVLTIPAAASAFGFRRSRNRLDRMETRLSSDLPGARGPVAGS